MTYRHRWIGSRIVVSMFMDRWNFGVGIYWNSHVHLSFGPFSIRFVGKNYRQVAA